MSLFGLQPQKFPAGGGPQIVCWGWGGLGLVFPGVQPQGHVKVMSRSFQGQLTSVAHFFQFFYSFRSTRGAGQIQTRLQSAVCQQRTTLQHILSDYKVVQGGRGSMPPLQNNCSERKIQAEMSHHDWQNGIHRNAAPGCGIQNGGCVLDGPGLLTVVMVVQGQVGYKVKVKGTI